MATRQREVGWDLSKVWPCLMLLVWTVAWVMSETSCCCGRRCWCSEVARAWIIYRKWTSRPNCWPDERSLGLRPKHSGEGQRPSLMPGRGLRETTVRKILGTARETIETWRQDYDEHRPNGSLGNVPSAEFACRHVPLAVSTLQPPEHA